VTETTNTRHEVRLETLLMMLMGIVILLMVAIIGLFVRMNQVQKAVLEAAAPLKAVAQAQSEWFDQSASTQLPKGLEAGTLAPSFTLTNTMGTPVSLANFAGQSVLLVFSSTHCQACSEMYPELSKFSTAKNDVQVLMISIGTVQEAQQMAQAQGFTFPVLPVPDWRHQVAQSYQVNQVPLFYVVDAEGIVVGVDFARDQKRYNQKLWIG